MNYADATYTCVKDCDSTEHVNEFKLGATYQCFYTWHDDSAMKQRIISFTFTIRKLYTGYAMFDYFLNIDLPKKIRHGMACGYEQSLKERMKIQNELGMYLFRGKK